MSLSTNNNYMPTLRRQQATGMPTEHEMTVFSTMAKMAVDSKMYKGIGDMSGVMMIMLTARELGLQPMQCLNGGLNIINGKVEISARMMNALIRKAGHSITITESTETGCKLIGKRGDCGDTATVEYTIAEATKAGLVKPGGNWTKCPKDMCFARALSRLARQLFSDVIGIGYVEGEIKADIPDPEPKPEVLDVNHSVADYQELFPAEDQALAMQYLQVVMKHFNWSQDVAIKELMKDTTALHSKFDKWRSKQTR